MATPTPNPADPASEGTGSSRPPRSTRPTRAARPLRAAGGRPPSGRWGRLTSRATRSWWTLLEQPAPWVAVALVVGSWVLLPAGLFFAPSVEPGTIAGRDYVAPDDLLVPDDESTQDKQRRAREDVLPVYDYDPGVLSELDHDVATLFEAGRRELVDSPLKVREGAGWPAEATRRLAEESGLKLAVQQVTMLADHDFSADLEDRLRGVVSQVLRSGVVSNKPLLLENRLRGITLRDLGSGAERTDVDLFDHLGYPDEVREMLESEVRNWGGLAARERRAMADLLLTNLPPNLHLNRSETVSRREAAAAATDPVFTQIRKGQMIVRQGDEVSPAQARAISRIAGNRPLHRRALPALGTFFLLALAVAVLWLALKGERVADQSRRRLFSEVTLLLLVALVGTKLFVLVATSVGRSFDAVPFNSVQSYLYCVPFAALALVASLLFGRGPALVLSLLFSLLVSRLTPGEPLAAAIYSLAGSFTAIYGLEKYQLKQRLVMTRLGLFVGLVNVAVILILIALAGGADRGPSLVAFDLACGFVGGLLVAAAVSFAVPILEAVFGITTDIKLVELANTNLPLLRRLAFEAPGTFQHSLMVANLAKVGCEAIEADATLAYTGGLYHDVGKVLRPEYFVENQRTDQNRHDKLLPSMSALILISHIKDGVELAREHHLPQPVVDAIEQHHGTRVIKFFYDRALKQCDPDTDEVREEKYRYPGPRPKNKVMGVLMLADGVEAASRTLVAPTEVKVRTLVRTLIDDTLADGQLDHTDLTLGDLDRIAEAFLRVLTNIFHRRVDYPGFDFNAAPRREPRSTTGVFRAS